MLDFAFMPDVEKIMLFDLVSFQEASNGDKKDRKGESEHERTFFGCFFLPTPLLQQNSTSSSVDLSAEHFETKILLFSATLPPWVNRLCRHFLRQKPNSVWVDLAESGVLATPSLVKHYAMKASRAERSGILGDCLKVYGKIHRRCIIFCDQKTEANELCVRRVEVFPLSAVA
ncbi:uncharacterized protein MONOS_9406 [Monocercomonoides exilis]|uniref:uncharacterized protein n=1 Tax=Monocercomonoides exilis TaxID=2049356 RepID=UPI00355A298C|nr:hypothetical protein MONOS_9406 [Monocercomonoides exilis]|eukprot:MONOS_9406.1-p1 / transcript=MONOS_9406.1 / gene=MONOS_9406 / organism=Monocercomonoides_exilis_PA203 / gene_product=unspecified product / transcript_product=unspecified product / location=Mono_scaffold00387:51789-52374(-) / protein_length=173 / sequence_SO=supercontig / SO=protein_coding / is_pseudo=false